MPDSTGSDRQQFDGQEDDQPRVADVSAFLEWRDRLPSFELDGERLYLPSGDIPMDEDQVEELWKRLRSARSQGGTATA